MNTTTCRAERKAYFIDNVPDKFAAREGGVFYVLKFNEIPRAKALGMTVIFYELPVPVLRRKFVKSKPVSF